MHRCIGALVITVIILQSAAAGDVCTQGQCKCSSHQTTVHCDSKGWTNLSTIEFPMTVHTLTLIANQLKLDTVADRAKIENLIRLTDLSLNQNLIQTIPAFNDSKIRSLSIQDNSITSAEFPSSYLGSFIQTILLNNNKIRTINGNDLMNLRNSKVNKLHLDNTNLVKIDQNAFTPLAELQALSLQNNQLKSCEFLSTLPLLSSIKLDENQFTSLPQELSSPKNIKTFSFKGNAISIIDDTSPLNTWRKMNHTNIEIFLANNPFDCCQSLWFIRFLKSSSAFVADAALLTCATPSNYAGQLLVNLKPDDMTCGGITPDKSWWTTYRIVGISVGGFVVVLFLIVIAVVVIRRRSSRSGYTEIGGVNDTSTTAPILSSNDPPFPSYGEEDDAFSTYSTALSRQTTSSHAPTHSTTAGVSVMDDIRI